MTSPQGNMGMPGFSLSPGDCSNAKKKPQASLQGGPNFADSRSLSWEYSPSQKSLSVAPDCPNSDTQTSERSIVKKTNIVDGGSLSKKGGTTYGLSVSRRSDSLQRTASPDLIPMTSHMALGVTPEVTSQGRTRMSKSASLTSLQPAPSVYFQTTSTSPLPHSKMNTRPVRRSGSSQSLSNLPTGNDSSRERLLRTPVKDVQQGHVKAEDSARGLPGFSSRRSSAKIMTGTMEAISNMIISRSGVSPKSGFTGRSSSLRPHNRTRTPEASAAGPKTTPEPRVTATHTGGHDSNTPNCLDAASNIQPSQEEGNNQPPCPPKRSAGSPMTSSAAQTDNMSSTAKTDMMSSISPKSKTVPLTRNNIITSQVDSVMLVSLAGSGMMTSPSASMLYLSGAKGYIMDKYFEEIAKSWDQQDASSTDGPPDVTACGREFSASDHQGAPVRPMQCSCGVERSENGGGADDSVSLHRAPCTHSKKDIRNSYSASNLRMYTQVDDLIHLEEPLTEEAVIKTLQARFYTGHYYTHIGPLLVLVNPLTAVPEPSPLSTNLSTSGETHLHRMLHEASQQHMETGLSQTLLLNGVSGSGKTHASLVLLRRLFDVAGGGSETDAFKHLQAALTVLRALGSAATCQNPHSSRMGYLIENDLSDGAIYRTKIHCYFIDQSRVVKSLANEKNFHIFYQMLAGLSMEERAKYRLTGHSSHTLSFLSSGDVTQDDVRDRQHFIAWKNALSVLGIPFADIMRVLSAILLLGNLEFVEGPGLELEVEGDAELQAVSSLLGVTTASLYRGLSTRTRRARGQIFKALADPLSANQARDALAKALYCRLVAAIIKRANNTKRLVVNCANSTDSNDSGHNEGSHQEALLSRSSTSRGSGFGIPTSQMESFIGVLDMFGFEKLQTNQFEQLCTNLCSETLQHFYNTHTFRAADEACAEEAITADIDVTYADNAPTIELLSSPRVGLLSLLDAECGLQRGCPETLLQKVHIQHSRNKLFFEPPDQNSHAFGIRHFCGDVIYDARDLLTANRNQLPDDIIATFTKQNCSFGFASHLFSPEIKAIQEDGGGPKGAVYRISPSPIAERSGELKGSLSADFHLKLDSILQLLVSSRPHFIRCIKSNDNHQRELFEREVVKQQLRSLQVLETLHLMAAGFPHRLRYRFFNSRYQVLLKDRGGRSDKQYEESKLILDKLLKTLDESTVPSSNAHWALGKKHIFLSEGCRQLLEDLRDRRRQEAATLVQSHWRRRMCLKKWPTLKRQLLLRKRDRQPIRKHVRRNSLLEGEAFRKLESDQHTTTQYPGDSAYMNGGSLPVNYISGQQSKNEPKRSHYGSHGSLYGQAPQMGRPAGNQPRAPDNRHGQLGNHGQYNPIYSQGVPNNQGHPAANGHRRTGSHDFGDRSGTNPPMGNARYSFHGDTRTSRPIAAGDVCNQRPRSKSSDRQYISHAEYQRQHNVRQRTYSSHSELSERLQNQPQRHLYNNGQGSRHSQSSHASSGSGSLGPPPPNPYTYDQSSREHPNAKGTHPNTNNNVYSTHRSNGLSNPRRHTNNNQSTHPPPIQQQPNPNLAPRNGPPIPNNNQYYKDHAVTNGRMTNGYDSQPSPRTDGQQGSSRTGSNDLHVTFDTTVEHPPPVPASRTYTVRGNMKLGYPQVRVLKQGYQESVNSPKLFKGQEIKVVGSAPKRGFLLAELGNEIIQVPFHLTDLKTMPLSRQGIDV